MIKLPFDKITAIADRTSSAKPVSREIAKLLASVDKNLPLPPAGTKFSVASIDELLKGKGLSVGERMRLKSELRVAGLLA
jgi:hypothetical protein